MWRALCLLLCLSSVATPALAATIHVPDDQPTIRAGVDAASAGDTVLVACGTYFEHDIAVAVDVTVMSESGDPSCVTINAEGDSAGAFVCLGVEFALEGLTITGGAVNCTARDTTGLLDVRNCIFEHCPTRGALSCSYHVSLRATECMFRYNQRCAVYMPDENPATAVIEDCDFYENTWSTAGGGGAHIGCAADISGCTFMENTAAAGGGLYAWGAAYLDVVDCVFSGNVAVSGNRNPDGGGLYAHTYGPLNVIRCAFIGNTSQEGGGGIYFATYEGPVLIEDCLFAGNTSPESSAAFCYNGTVTMRSVTVAANDGSPAIVSLHAVPTLVNSVVAFTTGGQAILQDGAGEVTLVCCDLYGNEGGDWIGSIAEQLGVDGNFSEDPLFCLDANSAEPYSLHQGSPCLPDGSPCQELVGAFGQGCGPVSPVEGTSWGAIKAMYR
jgi:predicted outer membrane repeat protein